MITVHTFGSAWDTVDLSPFVLKLLTWLRMAGVEHRTAPGSIRKAPRGKLPYIEEDGRLLGDSSLIIEHLQATQPSLRLAGDVLSPVEEAVAAAFKGMIESDLYFVILYSRWIEEPGYRLYRPALRASLVKMGFPSFLVPLAFPLLRRRMIAQAHAQGIGRFDRGIVLAKGRKHIDALASYLQDKPYFLGEAPSTLDATVFAFVDALAGTPLCPKLSEHLQRHANLVAYRARMRAAYWADFRGESAGAPGSG